MKKILSNIPRKHLILILILLIISISVAVPTLSRFTNGVMLPGDIEVWDGSVASSYSSGDGTKENPYIISNGSELAYFSEELINTNYDNTYFKLGNDIILNEGYFTYENNLKYVLNDEIKYVKKYTTETYNDTTYLEKSDLTINEFDVINEFAGNIDGSFYSIYGLYITEETEKDLAFINNLTGEVKDLFIENMFIEGSGNVAGLANSINTGSISSLYVHGNVLSNGLGTNDVFNEKIKDISITTSSDEMYYELLSFNKNVEVISASVKGNLEVGGEADYSVSIDGTELRSGEFTVDLNVDDLSNIYIYTPSDSENRSVTFSNLEYEIIYNELDVSALSNNIVNSNINNTVTNTNVYSEISANGFASVITGEVNITNSYNLGDISGNVYSSSIVGNVNDSTLNIDKVYNDGKLRNESAFISNIDSNSLVNLKNSFNNQNGNIVLNNNSDNLIIDNVYNYHEPVVEPVKSMVNPYTREFFDNLSLGDYNSEIKSDSNVWIYNDLELPSLYYINEINLIDIRIGNDSWNKLSTASGNAYYNKNINVAVTSSSYTYSLDTVEYYIVNGGVALKEEELQTVEWLPYNSAFSITEEGTYIVYVKLKNYDGEVRYINTDKISIDKNDPTIALDFENDTWTSFRKDVKEIYMEDNSNFTINAEDSGTGIESISYYVSDSLITENQLDNLNEANWNEYNSEFSITPVGTNVLYARATDYSGNVSYSNSDIITFDGYYLNYMEAGRNDLFTSDSVLNISDKSSITANYIYNLPSEPLGTINHTLNFNQTLPLGTVITISDKINNKTYDYEVNSNNISDIVIPFVNFNSVGTVNSYYAEGNYDNGTNIVENFVVTLNFENAVIVNNINNVAMWLEVVNESGDVIRNTSSASIKSFNIYNNSNANLYLNTSTPSFSLQPREDSITNININTGINYSAASGNDIIDSFIEEQDIVLKFKIYDQYDKSVSRSKLNNMVFKIDGKEFYPNESGEFIVNLESGILAINKTLEIYSYKGDSFLEEGSYKLNVTSYISYNEHISDYNSNMDIYFNVDKNALSSNISFESTLKTDPVIKKELGTQNIEITSKLTGLDDPVLKISLYKKNVFNSLDQNYTLVNLDDYVTSGLTADSENYKYIIPRGDYSFDLNLALMEKNSYKIVIESYDGNTFISRTEKYIIIK